MSFLTRKTKVVLRLPESGARLSQVWAYLLFSALQCVACGTSSRSNQTASGDGSFPRDVRAGDAVVRIPHKPGRIISLTPSNDEILCALVEERRIAGLSKFSQDPATSYVTETARRINVFVDRNAEQVVSLQPDLVLAARYTKIDLKALLAETRTPLVVTTDFRNFTDVESNLRLIGQAVGEERRAEVVISEMRQKLTAARSRLRPEGEGMRALYFASGNFSAGAGTSIHEILIAAGLKNAAAEAGIKGHVKLAPEQVIQIDPDVILIGAGYDRDRGFRQSLESDGQLSPLKAIKEKRIIEVPARSVLTVSHHVADAVETLVEAVNQLLMTKGGA